MSGRAPTPLKRSPIVRAKTNNGSSRIPLEYCDGPSQRLYAASLFVAVQSLKLWYWLNVSHSSYALGFISFVLWLGGDALYLMLLNYLRIPWLELPLLRFIAAFTALVIVNFVLFTAPEISPSAMAYTSAEKVLNMAKLPFSWASGSQSDISYDDDKHLLGRHTVLMQPYGSADINPENRCFCIASPKSKLPLRHEVWIPVSFNGSVPTSIEYSITDFETGNEVIHKFQEGSHFKLDSHHLKDDRVVFFKLQAKTVGAYKLKEILDKDGKDVKLYRKEVIVVECPEAHLQEFNQQTQFCASKFGQIEVPISVGGLPPWSVTYEKRRLKPQGNHDVEILEIETEPKDYSSPFLPGWSDTPDSSYKWAVPRAANMPVEMGLASPGEYDFQVTEVRDGCGNKVNYKNLRAKRAIGSELKKVAVRPRPSVSMDCDPRTPIKIFSLGDSPSTNISLKLQGQPPFTVQYSYQGNDLDKAIVLPELHVAGHVGQLTATRPGLYNVLSVKDAFCEGDLATPSECSVVVAPVPTVAVTTTTIDDQCVGAIGLTFTAMFTGEAPWSYCYVVYRDNVESRQFCDKSSKVRHEFTERPKVPGTYRYEFKTVSDANYQDVQVRVPSVTQKIHPQPKAEFAPNQSGIKMCRGGTPKSLKVNFIGRGPWDLSYNIHHKNTSTAYSIKGVQSDTTNIRLPAFDDEGTFRVDLASVKDNANGCSRALTESDIILDVSSAKPTAIFQCKNPIEFPEGGTVDLPIHLTGGGPWIATYGLENKTPSVLMSPTRNAKATVHQPGVYHLFSVKDSYCDGEIFSQQESCTVKFSPRPSMNLKIDSIRFRGGPAGVTPDDVPPSEMLKKEGGEFVVPSVCQDASRTLEIKLEGKAPFDMNYDVLYKPTRGSAVLSPRTESYGHSPLRLPIATDKPGTYTYHLKTLSDDIYKGVLIKHEGHDVKFRHTVLAPPRARIAAKERQFNYCKNEVIDMTEKIGIQIEDGTAPFALTLEIQHPENAPQVFNLYDVVPNQKGIFEWSVPTQFSSTGLYKISVLRVTDSTGCSTKAEDPRSSIEIDISNTPTITPLKIQRDYCVGDEVGFILQGEAPFKVTYSLNKITSTIDTKDKVLEFRVPASGLLSIGEVCHQVGEKKKTCCTRPQEMTRQVWSLPSAKISGGKEVIQNLKDGDRAEIIVDFEGEPPFAFTYTHKEAEVDGFVVDANGVKRRRPAKLLERKSIAGIKERRFSIFTATVGTFEVVDIQDKHCRYPRVPK